MSALWIAVIVLLCCCASSSTAITYYMYTECKDKGSTCPDTKTYIGIALTVVALCCCSSVLGYAASSGNLTGKGKNSALNE